MMLSEYLGWDHLEGEKWADVDGVWPSKLGRLVGEVFFHPKTGHLYRVDGMVFQSEDQRWMVAYRRISKGGLCTGPLFCHRLEDFEREGRFMLVKK
jgi:hypothetical protein